jgi:hypothetical protein
MQWIHGIPTTAVVAARESRLPALSHIRLHSLTSADLSHLGQNLRPAKRASLWRAGLLGPWIAYVCKDRGRDMHARASMNLVGNRRWQDDLCLLDCSFHVQGVGFSRSLPCGISREPTARCTQGCFVLSTLLPDCIGTLAVMTTMTAVTALGSSRGLAASHPMLAAQSWPYFPRKYAQAVKCLRRYAPTGSTSLFLWRSPSLPPHSGTSSKLLSAPAQKDRTKVDHLQTA